MARLFDACHNGRVDRFSLAGINMIDFKLFGLVFATVFLAELGDKTQLAALLFSSREPGNLFVVFAAASLALVTSTAIAVIAGASLAQYIDPKTLSWIAGAGFILIGIWTLWTTAIS